MGRIIYCDFPRCKNECVGLCTLHSAINQPIKEAYLQHCFDMSFNDFVLEIWPIVEAMEEQWRDIHRLQRQLHSAENELQRILAGT